jgi:hypothetical protein
MMLALGRAYRFPGSPAAKSNEPMEHACPLHSVDTGDWMYCFVVVFCLFSLVVVVDVHEFQGVRRSRLKMKGRIISDLDD